MKGKDGGDVKPKGFRPREWVDVPLSPGADEPREAGKQVSILSWNVRAALSEVLCRLEVDGTA